MKDQIGAKKGRELLDQTLTEISLFAKKLCPGARVEASSLQYEDEDGRVRVFPPPHFSEEDEERLEEALAEKCVEAFEQTGLFILCALFDSEA